MGAEGDRELVTELARTAVERLAADELVVFDAVAEAHLTAPRRVSRAAARADEPLGLGVEAASVLISTAALTVSVEVVKHLAVRYSERAAERAERGARRWFRRNAETPEPVPLPEFTPEQLDKVRELARGRARALRLSEEQSALLADAIVGGLAARSEGR